MRIQLTRLNQPTRRRTRPAALPLAAAALTLHLITVPAAFAQGLGGVVGQRPQPQVQSLPSEKPGNYVESLGLVYDFDPQKRPVVTEVIPGGPAERAGVRPGLVFTRVNDWELNQADPGRNLFFFTTGAGDAQTLSAVTPLGAKDVRIQSDPLPEIPSPAAVDGVVTINSDAANQLVEDGLKRYDQKQFADAYKLFFQAAQNGSTRAKYIVGVMTEQGEGVPADPKAAAGWYRHAVAGGSNTAMNNLGLYYENAPGPERNPLRAFYLYREAARLGNVNAMTTYGATLINGKVVQKDLIEGMAWLGLAGDFGDTQAASEFKRLLGTLTPDQDAAVKARLAALTAKYKR
jgi:hypothetical protein